MTLYSHIALFLHISRYDWFLGESHGHFWGRQDCLCPEGQEGGTEEHQSDDNDVVDDYDDDDDDDDYSDDDDDYGDDEKTKNGG